RRGRLAEARSDAAAYAKLARGSRFAREVLALVELHAGEAEASAALKAINAAGAADPTDTDMLFTAARVYAVASAQARIRETTAAAALSGAPTVWSRLIHAWPQPPREDEHAQRALGLLTMAVEQGYRDFAAVETDPLLAAVWQRPGWSELLHRAGGRRRYG